MSKKYFWLKLKEDFFRQKEIKKLRSIAGGDTYTVIYLKMQLLSIKNAGKLFFENVGDDFANELSLELDEDENNVKMTLAFLERHGLIEYCDNNEYLLHEAVKSIGSETDVAERVRKHREKKNKLLQCNEPETICYTEIDIDIDIDKDIDKDKDKEKDNTTLDSFEIFWMYYDKKTSRNKCLAKWKKIKPELHQTIYNHVKEYVKSTPDKKYRKNPETYLNNECWNDEIVYPKGTVKPVEQQQEDFKKLCEENKKYFE